MRSQALAQPWREWERTRRMTKSEYQELVEFIDPRFDGIDIRFDADRRVTRLEEGLSS